MTGFFFSSNKKKKNLGKKKFVMNLNCPARECKWNGRAGSRRFDSERLAGGAIGWWSGGVCVTAARLGSTRTRPVPKTAVDIAAQM